MRVIDLLRGWDTDGDGIVSEPEFVNALRALGFEFEPETAAQLFADFDADGSGKVDLKELKRKILETGKVLEAEREADEPDETGAVAAAGAPALTSLDLADNQLGGGALGPLLRVLRGGACALRALDLSRNRLPERACTCTCTCICTCYTCRRAHASSTCTCTCKSQQHASITSTCQHANVHICIHIHIHIYACAAIQESMALRLTDALGANTSLTRLSLASVGLLAQPATALGDALRRNAKVGANLSPPLQCICICMIFMHMCVCVCNAKA